VVVVTAKQAMTAGEITATVAGGYKFIIDYDKFRKNIPLLVVDIRRASGRIKKSVQNLLGEPKIRFVGDYKDDKN
jgi:hypothetical protein